MTLIQKITSLLPILVALTGCIEVPKTAEFDKSVSYTEVVGYKFHTEVLGKSNASTVIVVHGGPGGDYGYLTSLKALSKDHKVVFYDQRGTGLSPRVDSNSLTLKQSLDDLHALVQHFSPDQPVKLIGHSWGGMLVAGYLSAYPKQVSQAVMVEPGMLHPKSAEAFIEKMKASQSISSLIALVRYMSVYPFVHQEDGHEGFDYVMTQLLNLHSPGAPYQCEGESMPRSAFHRGGYEAFSNMLQPLMDDPSLFTYDLTEGINQYSGKLMLISSECSVFGYDFQQQHHLPKLPKQTLHVKAEKMGHYMLTLNPEWSIPMIAAFFLNTP